MVSSIRLVAEPEKQIIQINNFFRKDLKIKYSRKLSGKVRLYISEKNALKSISGILTVYENALN